MPLQRAFSPIIIMEDLYLQTFVHILELIDEMIADAWYMVTEYHLRLGPLGIADNLEEVLKYIIKITR